MESAPLSWVRARVLLEGSIGILPVPAFIDAISGLAGQFLIDVEATRERGDVVKLMQEHRGEEPFHSRFPADTA